MISLEVYAAIFQQELPLFFRLHALGDDIQVQAFRDGDDCAYYRSIAAIRGYITHKRLIELELIEWQPFEPSTMVLFAPDSGFCEGINGNGGGHLLQASKHCSLVRSGRSSNW